MRTSPSQLALAADPGKGAESRQPAPVRANTLPLAISRAVVRFRDEPGVSDATVAAECGVRRQMVQMWATVDSGRVPHLDHVAMLSDERFAAIIAAICEWRAANGYDRVKLIRVSPQAAAAEREFREQLELLMVNVKAIADATGVK